MRTIIIPCLITSLIACSPALRADSAYRAPHDQTQDSLQDDSDMEESWDADEGQLSTENASPQGQDTTTTPIVPEEDGANPSEATTLEDIPADEDDEGTPVGQAADEGSRAAKRKQWRNVALAVGAVAVAITALILVSSNDGHHSKDK